MHKKVERNLATKMLALVLAMILWLYVMNEQNPPIDAAFTVPLEVRNVTTDFLVADAPESVRIKVRGPRNVIAGLQGQEIKSFIDLKGLNEGRHSVKVNAVLPTNLELAEISPDKVSLRLDISVSRRLPLTVKTAGTLVAGIRLDGMTPAVEEAVLEGPKTAMNQVDKVLVTVDLSGKAADFAMEERLLPVDQQGREVEGVIVKPARTKISLALSQEQVRKTVDVKPAIQGDLAAGFSLRSVTVDPVRIELRAPAKLLEKVDFVYTEPVNLNGVSRNVEREVKIRTPEGISASPATVTVRVQVGPTGE
ncbi:MAG TPA: CdaR family protein [Patescibacteria group bacterium]|nr:CdaR family protein [Patescibacteria group bacterium]